MENTTKKAVENTAQNGNTIKLEYTGKLEDGTIFDTSEGKAPLEFKLGEGKLIKGFENAVIGMKQGEEKEFTLEPKDAYGDRNNKLIQTVPISSFPAKMELKKGMTLTLKDPNNRMLIAQVTDIDDKDVTIDLNHPLAGKKLTFKIKIISIK